jgi:hypothetical protein
MFGRHKQTAGGPSASHGFVEPRDSRSGLAVSTAHAELGQSAGLAVADASMREARCAMKGCGKLRHDPIHLAQE